MITFTRASNSPPCAEKGAKEEGMSKGDHIRLSRWPCTTCKSAIAKGAFIPCPKAMQLVVGKWFQQGRIFTVARVSPDGDVQPHGATCLWSPDDIEQIA